MELRRLLADAAPDRGTVFTIGVFDGVHRGHCHLLSRLTESAAASQWTPAVITFSNHPATILRPDFQVKYLTSPEAKVELLKAQGVELVIPLEFTRELSQMNAGEFARTLVEVLQLKGLVIGPDFAFGKDREGNEEFLRRAGQELEFWVETVAPLMLGGAAVRSRRIRQLIADGDLAAGNELLGREFRLAGVVVQGDRRGRELGFPTANVSVPDNMALPGDGIYATWAIVDGERLPSATSIGIRPTFGLTERLVEVYIFDFDADLYGKTLGVEFVEKLRDQEAFGSVEALIDQVNQDVADARRSLAQDGGVRIG